MPTFYEGSVGTVETEITREEFTAAWRLDQERNGRLKNIGVKRAAAMVVFLAVIFWGIPAYSRYFATVWAPLILAAGCGAVLVYGSFSRAGWNSRGKRVLIPRCCWENHVKYSYTGTAISSKMPGRRLPAIGRTILPA